MYKTVLLIFLLFSHIFSEIASKQFYISPTFKLLKTDMGSMVNYQGIRGGMILNDNHVFSGEGYYQTREKGSTEELSGNWENDHRLYVTLFAAYSYQWNIAKWFKAKVGLSGGFQITERDKNWDEIEPLTVKLSEGSNFMEQQILTRKVAESKYVSFGGPTVSTLFGGKRVFFEVATRLNIGYKKNFGSITILDNSVSNFSLEKPYTYEDVLISSKGTYNRNSTFLDRVNTLQPELLLSVTIFL